MPDNTRRRRWRTTPAKQIRSQQLRREATPAEALLWSVLRDRQFAGYKFRRQHPIDRFIVDFCCVERGLVIELDGGVHQQQADYDALRDAVIRSAGYEVVRFTNEQAIDHLADVLKTIALLLIA